MKISRVLVISSVIVTTLAVMMFFILSDTGDAQRPLSFEEFAVDSGQVDLSGEGRPGLYVTDLIEPDRSENILDDVRAGRINLLSELRRLRSYCADEAPGQECDEMVIDFLHRLPEPDGGKLVELFETYRKYEMIRSRGDLAGEAANLNPTERYARIRKIRREIFAHPEDAQLVFGLQEAHMDFQEIVRRFASGEEFAVKSTTAAGRLAEFEAARATAFGPYYETLREREPADARLGMEILVRQSELEGLEEAERAAIMHELRVRHLGADRADEIQVSERKAAVQAAEQNAKLDGFLRAEQEFLAANQDLPIDERLAKIEELRKHYYRTE